MLLRRAIIESIIIRQLPGAATFFHQKRGREPLPRWQQNSPTEACREQNYALQASVGHPCYWTRVVA